MIKIIHVAKRELRMDEATDRTMLRCAGKADSTASMSIAGLRAVLVHAKRAGFKVRAKASVVTALGGATARPDRRQDNSDMARKARALWLFLYQLGAVRDPSERALAAYAKRIIRIDDLHWASGDAMHDLVETLKKWALRPAYLPAAILTLKEQLRAAHGAGRLTPEQIGQAKRGFDVLQIGVGFDVQRYGFELLSEALIASSAAKFRAEELIAGSV